MITINQVLSITMVLNIGIYSLNLLVFNKKHIKRKIVNNGVLDIDKK